jgi:hypothetical protein
VPKASYSVQVSAPVETVWRLLLDKIENPGTYVPGVSAVKILDRQPGYVIRSMKTGDIEVVERITVFAKRHEVDFVLVDHPVYAGQVVNRIEPPLRPGLSCTLTFALDWRRKDGEADSLDLQATIERAVRQTKTLAERAESA